MFSVITPVLTPLNPPNDPNCTFLCANLPFLSEIKDQGYTRPRVLILFPFRNAAVEFVDQLIKLCPKSMQNRVISKKRFHKTYGPATSEPLKSKPNDFNSVFTGNMDDCFRMGLNFTSQSVQLFSQFYKSDMILASPLGLKLAVGDGYGFFRFRNFLGIFIL